MLQRKLIRKGCERAKGIGCIARERGRKIEELMNGSNERERDRDGSSHWRGLGYQGRQPDGPMNRRRPIKRVSKAGSDERIDG